MSEFSWALLISGSLAPKEEHLSAACFQVRPLSRKNAQKQLPSDLKYIPVVQMAAKIIPINSI